MRFNGGFGICYGATLTAHSFIAAGYGHGTYIPWVVSSAPIWLLGTPAALLGAPALWDVVGAIAVRRFKLAIGAILVHYAAAAGGVGVALGFGAWEYVATMARFKPWLLPVWALVYVAGQIVAWRTIMRGTA
jgi:hypothetical protein